MKKSLFSIFLIPVLLASFIGLAVFGFAAMSHAEGHNPNGCIAAAARETDCSRANNPLAMFNLHIDALKSFSTLIFGNSSLQMLLLLAFSLVFLLSFKIFSVLPLNFIYSPINRVSTVHFIPKQKINFSNWFSFHENSPSIN